MPDLKRNNLSVRGIPKNKETSNMVYVTNIPIVLMQIIIKASHLNTSC